MRREVENTAIDTFGNVAATVILGLIGLAGLGISVYEAVQNRRRPAS